MSLSTKDLAAIEEIVDRKVVNAFQITASHLNLNTTELTILGKRIEGSIPKAIIGWQCRKDSWPDKYWSSVMLFGDDDISFPPFVGDWEFRYVYADVK